MVPARIRQMTPYQHEMPVQELEREVGVHIAELGLNENPFGPSPKAVEAIRGYAQNIDRYPDDTGYYLRLRLAQAFNVSVDQIIIGVGISDLLAMIYQALFGPDTVALTSEGSFIVYYLLAATTGMKMVCIPLKNYAYDLDAMAERLTSETRLIVIANPNNPTGTLIRRKEFEAFMKRVPQDVLVVVDEAYFEYVSDPAYPNSFDYLRDGWQVLILRTFSKAYGLAGVRVGFGIGSREVIETLYKVRMPFCASSAGLIAALAAWDDRDHVEKCVRLNRIELDFLSRELSARGVKHVPSHTNFVFLEIGAFANQVSTGLLKQGVLVRPLDGWGLPTAIRVSVGTHEQNLKFLQALERVL